MAKRILNFFEKYSIHILAVVIVGVFFWIIGTFSYSTTVEEDVGQSIKDFNSHWEFAYNGEARELIEIPVKMPVRRGNSFAIINKLPADLEDGMSLVFCTTRQTGNVYINGVLILELANRSGSLFDKFPISKIHYIPLKQEYANQEIEIELRSYSLEFSGRVNEMYYGEYGECIKTSLVFQAPIAALYLFILFVGIALSAIFFFIQEQKKRYFEVLLLGVTTVNLVLSVASDYNIFQAYMKNDIQVSVIGLISKLSLPFVYLLYITATTKSKQTRRLLKWLSVIFTTVCTGILLAQAFQLLDLGACMTVYTISSGLMFLSTIILIIIEVCREYRYSEVPLFLALHIFMFTIIVEVFSYFENVMSYRNFGVFLGAGAICSLAIIGAVSTNSIIHTFEENRRINEELLRKRVDLMIRQIQPHFVYNTLNSIQSLIEIDAAKASQMIYNFSKYLRTHVDMVEMEGMISFAEELESIKAYVDIELVRYHKIRVVYDIQEKDFFLPMLSIQPLVENAIRYGVSKKLVGGTVTIKSYLGNQGYVIEINDDGVGFTPKVKSESSQGTRTYSVGMKNITYRLNKLINATVQCKSTVGEGTSVRIEIPKRGGEVDADNFSR